MTDLISEKYKLDKWLNSNQNDLFNQWNSQFRLFGMTDSVSGNYWLDNFKRQISSTNLQIGSLKISAL